MDNTNTGTAAKLTRMELTGTGAAPPRYGGTARPDNLSARMKNSVVPFPDSVKVVHPKTPPGSREGTSKPPGARDGKSRP